LKIDGSNLNEGVNINGFHKLISKSVAHSCNGGFS